MSSCKTCDNQTSIIETQSEIIQKRIQKQVRVPSSMYTMNFAALNTVINNNNVGKKHDSYQRRLNKLKQRNIVENTLTDSESPLKGNKSKSYNITPCVPSLNNFLKEYGISKAYNFYNKLNNLPTTLTLGSGDTSYNFGGYKDDVTVIDDPNGNLEISYGTYNAGIHGVVGASVSNHNIDKITFFIDFKINNLIDSIPDSSLCPIFEIGKKFQGTSLTLRKINNTIYISFFSGSANNINSENVIYDNNNFTSRLNERNTFVASFEKTGNSGIDFKHELYLNNEKVFEKDKLDFARQFFNNSGYGFGKRHPNSNNEIAVKKDWQSSIGVNGDTTLNITGQFRIFNNTYQELVKSNYFSNL